ncbi:transcriptional repressor [Hoyosella sp. YIM 151337]|uniref:Fur family transcriptional regulator n=1 Tax=Hoyosella sp. YIM 151337 TaxID=2992742 RepID=UPI00223647BF|nr:Fur family transcriptional regulator [Hoyosella sp. YIM 151337]MCW4355316.1 transcriptional repressor [Hoyosella sp. YIM 151337]
MTAPTGSQRKGSAPAIGVRSTRQRAAVSALLDDVEEFRSAQDIHDELRRRGEGIGLTTVYRTLQSLAETGAVDVLRTDSGEAVYRRCSSGHHHHLVCRDCGYTVEIKGDEVERWSHAIASENGFTDISHIVEVFGVCKDCQES